MHWLSEDKPAIIQLCEMPQHQYTIGVLCIALVLLFVANVAVTIPCSRYAAASANCIIQKVDVLRGIARADDIAPADCIGLDRLYFIYRKYFEPNCQWDNWGDPVTSHHFGTLFDACDVNNDGQICINESPENVCECLATCQAAMCVGWGTQSWLRNIPVSPITEVDTNERHLNQTAVWNLYHSADSQI